MTFGLYFRICCCYVLVTLFGWLGAEKVKVFFLFCFSFELRWKFFRLNDEKGVQLVVGKCAVKKKIVLRQKLIYVMCPRY